MSRAAWLIVLVSATAAAAPLDPVSVARPDLPFDIRRAATEDRIDVSDLQRWPLATGRFLSLEPSYPLARWQERCDAGEDKIYVSTIRPGLQDYLRAWCAIARHETDAAIARLAPLLRSSVKNLPAAVRLDLAMLLVDTGDARAAQRALTLAGVRSGEVDDLLAAAYAEANRPADATYINELALDRALQPPAERCQRLARRLILSPRSERHTRLDDFRNYLGDQTCKLLQHELQCWNGGSCEDYIREHGIDPELAVIVDIYVQWPTSAVTANRWLLIADEAFRYSGRQGADLLGVNALEGAMRSSRCTGEHATLVRAAAVKQLTNTYRDRAFDQRLRNLDRSPCVLPP